MSRYKLTPDRKAAIIATLPPDLRDQVEAGLITLAEAGNIAKGLNPNGTKKT